MRTIKHRFLDHQINPETEILILGTFNPDTEKNEADFFYGRGQNYLWQILSEIYQIENLKKLPRENKLSFIKNKKIDFIDLISEVEVDDGQETNYKDDYIDSKVTQWNNVIREIEKHKKIKRIGLTRKTFNGIPNMKNKIDEIRKYCSTNNIVFQFLITPARHPNYYGKEHMEEWTNFFKND
jgi:G:T/U-mismatch repair DNA glycosylase